MSGNLIESLESRRMLSASIALVGGVLKVVGESALANTIVIKNTRDGLSLDVSIVSLDRKGAQHTVSDTIDKSRGIDSLNIAGGSRADTIRIDQGNGAISLAARIDGKAGNDTIAAGDGNDLILGSAGNDVIDAGTGANTVRGAAGNDSITGGNDADRLDAGPGNDTVRGGDGDDLLVGGAGKDLIYGGTGNDAIYGAAGNDTLWGDDGNDTVWGGAGNDDVHGGNGDDRLGGFLGRNTLNGGAGHDEFVQRPNAANASDYDDSKDILNTATKDDGNHPPVI